MSLSAGTAIEKAFGRMTLVCFSPFDLTKWCVLGFALFVASFGTGAGGNAFNVIRVIGQFFTDSRSDGKEMFEKVSNWAMDNLTLVVTLGILALLVLGTFTMVLAWLRARFTFILLDGIAKNRAAIKEPWREFRHEGNRLFGFNLALGAAMTIGLMLVLLLGVLIALPDINARHFGGMSILAIVVAVLLWLAIFITGAIIGAVTSNFVVPIMYHGRTTVREGWRVFRAEVLPGNFWMIVLFFLLKIALLMGAGMLAQIVTCLTCCMAAIPYVSSVVLLPVTVVLTAYSLAFLEQLGPQWKIMSDPVSPAGAQTLPPPQPAPE